MLPSAAPIRIAVDAEIDRAGNIVATSRATQQMVAALKQAIAAQDPSAAIEVVPAAGLQAEPSDGEQQPRYCPLTIALPDSFEFPGRAIYQACKDVRARQQWVEAHLQCASGLQQPAAWAGNYWLPMVLTAKGPLYGEAIGEGMAPNTYRQPIELDDHQRQQLYRLGHQLLHALAAPPAVYLLQFGYLDGQIAFDRLWPFPAAPALASVGVQSPDLFACHWQCLTGRPVCNLAIRAQAAGWYESG
ncbi:MAG: hypothetical protein BRC58_04375 [Cyanobacteria bacterium QS_8_64_29]|nr:MAG: hypothetical protein BRC58_04375 [Cyanobacteria bacterium QS_8_64_29]